MGGVVALLSLGHSLAYCHPDDDDNDDDDANEDDALAPIMMLSPEPRLSNEARPTTYSINCLACSTLPLKVFSISPFSLNAFYSILFRLAIGRAVPCCSSPPLASCCPQPRGSS